MLCGALLAPAGRRRKSFNAITYSADGVPKSVIGAGFKPELALIKDLVNTNKTILCGFNLNVSTPSPYSPYPERRIDLTTSTYLYYDNGSGVSSFDTDGFTISAGDEVCKDAVSSQNFMAWLWKRDPDLFNILNWDGDSNASRVIPHGLTSVPKMVWAFKREAADDVAVYHVNNTANPETDWLKLNSNAATADLDSIWADTAPDATNITVGLGKNAGGTKYAACVFAEQAGRSKFGSYTGNGSATGPVVNGFGFRPKAIIIKRTDSGGNWRAYDRNRKNGGATEYYSVQINSTSPAASGVDVDLQEDGFQPQTNNGTVNANGGTYVYAAWA